MTAGLLLTGCNAGSDSTAATTTAAVAPPTTALAAASTQPTTTSSTSAPTTTTTTTSTPPTTAAPTTLPATTAVVASTQPTAGTTPEKAVSERSLNYERAKAVCLEQPAQCEVDKLVAEYYFPNARAEQVQTSLEEWIAKDQRYTKIDQITAMVQGASIAPDGLGATTTTCIRNGAVRVDSKTNEVINDTVGYFRDEAVWVFVSGRWLIADKSTYDVQPGESDPCGF